MTGIYGICCGNRVYVGQSIDIRRRRREHERELIRGEHENYVLQDAFDEYGGEFFVIEECSRAELDVRESVWISRMGLLNIAEPKWELEPYYKERTWRAWAPTFLLPLVEKEKSTWSDVCVWAYDLVLREQPDCELWTVPSMKINEYLTTQYLLDKYKSIEYATELRNKLIKYVGE